MAYTAGLYTKASEASAAEAGRFRQFQTDIDAMAAREREAIRRQQQAVLDRQYAGLVTPGRAPDFVGGVQPPKPEQFPTGTALPEQVTPKLVPAPPGVGLSSFPTQGMSPGLSTSGTGSGGFAEHTQEQFKRLPVEEQQRLLDEANKTRNVPVSGPMGSIGYAGGPKLTMDQFVASLPTDEQRRAGVSVSSEGKGDFAPTAPAASAAGVTPTAGLTAPAATATATATNSLVSRATDIPNVMGSDSGQAIIRRASELGVDPAAAIAIYGIETDFGRNVGTSGKGAVGPLQVMPDQAVRLKKWFTNQENIRQFNIPETLVAAATAMTADSVDAGLLQLKYNELIGLPVNLWGAGYQANANDVLKAGRPLAVDDGNLSNAAYNDAYVALYNEARKYVGTAPEIAARPVSTATFNLEQIDREEQALTAGYQSQLQLLQQQNERILQQRNIAAQQLQLAQQSGFANRVPELQQRVLELDNLLMGVNTQATTLNATFQTAVKDFNLLRTKEFATVALDQMQYGNPAPLADMWSRATGMDIQVQPRDDGAYNVYVNGKLKSGATGISPAEVAHQFQMRFDQAYREAEVSRRAEEAKERFKTEQEMAKETLKTVGQIEVAKINQLDKRFPGWTKTQDISNDQGVAVGFMAVGTGANAGKILSVRLKPGMEIKDGLVTSDSFDIQIVGGAGLSLPTMTQ